MMRRQCRSSCGSLFSFTQARLMRFSSPPPPPPSALKNDKMNTTEENIAHQQPIAILSDITKPVKLPDDYVPYPLPKYDRRSGEIEPLPFDSKTNNNNKSNEATTTTYEGERTQMKLQQQMQTKSSFAARPTFFGEEFDQIRRFGDGDDEDDRSNEVEREALAVAEEILSRRKQQLQQVALSTHSGGRVDDDDALYATPEKNRSQEKESLGKYTRQPSENGNILDRPICLRPMQELVEQLTHPFPNFERNMAALNDITSKFEDFLQVVSTFGTSDTQTALQVEHESLLRTLFSSSKTATPTPKNTDDTKDSVADVDVDSILKLKKIYQHRSESHASILNDYLHVSKNLRDMFVGSSLALNLRLFRQGQVIIPTFQNDSTAQQSFWKYFAETESLMVRFVLPELVEILSNHNIRVDDHQQQRLALLLECLTEQLNIIAHFQLLDHARHMTNHHLMPSGKLDRYGSGGRYSWSHATGALFLDELTALLSATNNLRSMRQSGLKNRFLSEEEEIAQQMTQDGENENELATSSKFAAIGALPTKTLSEWFVFFSSSYIRDGEHQKLTKNVDLTQELATELILHRLGPACKIAFGLTNGKDSSALFLDAKINNNNENEEPLLLLGVESGAERSKIVSDILFACSLSNVTLPADFLQEALLNGALVASEQNPEKIIISSPNFFVAMAKLFGGGNSCFPAEQLFRLAELEIKKFRKHLDAAEHDGNSDLLMSLHNTEHDWISAIYELAFACHDRSAAITFLEDQINFKEESIFKHAMRFADPNGKIFADFNLKEAGSYDNDSGALIGREHSNNNNNNNNNNIVAETCRIRQSAGAGGSPLAVGMSAGNSELFRDVDPSYSSSESHSFFPSSLQELTENTQTILQSSVFPSHTKKSNGALAEFLSGSNGKVGGGDDFTIANRRVAAARSCFVLHHTIVKENNFDGLREAIDQCHDNHAVLIVPSTVLWQLTSFTADSSSRSGRLHFEVMKKKIVCALFEEFMEGRAFLISPAEEVLIRYHEGHADADTLVWEACSFLQARAPTTAFFVLAEEGSRCANHIALFSRQTTSGSILTEEQKTRGGGGGSTKNLIPHPLTKHLQPEMLNNQMRRDQIGAIDWQNPMLGERVAGVLWSPDAVRGFDSNFRGAMAARIRDPTGKKSMPGLFMANSRGDRYSFQDMRNYQDKVDSCRGKKIRRVMKGHSFNAVYDDLNDLGIYTPDHV